VQSVSFVACKNWASAESRFLRQSFYSTDVPLGVMGQKTQQALRDFQKSKNLKATGRLDDQTANALGVSIKDSAPRS
jgi:peptidoglycan hydrolase-like protein with peptidoglycan-binding domain